mmetsp:Transcript_44553/g.73117  ORF Transcript_44553/g.73117 Transcript_44553/m.73117 type:complete len:91 (-) Transcript_44553:822-1094(-)
MRQRKGKLQLLLELLGEVVVNLGQAKQGRGKRMVVMKANQVVVEVVVLRQVTPPPLRSPQQLALRTQSSLPAVQWRLRAAAGRQVPGQVQ